MLALDAMRVDAGAKSFMKFVAHEGCIVPCIIARMNRLSRRVLLGGGVLAGIALTAVAMRSCASPAIETSTTALVGVNVIPRTAWGAQSRITLSRIEAGDYHPTLNRAGWRVYDQPLNEVLRLFVVHHSALPASDGPREIQRLHQVQRGFADVGYHYLIDASGIIYEGRPITVRGAHVAGHNTGAVGVCLLGNFEKTEPAPAQLASLTTLALALRGAFGITHLAGHRDLPSQNTLCPGANLWPRLPALAAQLGLAYGTPHSQRTFNAVNASPLK